VENVAKKKRKRNTTVKNAKPKRRKRRSNAHLKKKSVENVLLYKLPNLESKTKKGTRVILFHNSVFTDCICGNKSLFFRKKK